jgi:flavorubredoxin/rubredoxin
MQARKIGEGVWWVGAIDWDRRLFDGLIPLPEGTSYNSFFVQGTKKSVLIDAVDPGMKEVLFKRLKSLNVAAIDYVVANHIEQDHSGSIPQVLEAYPMAKVLASDIGKPLMMDMLDVPEDKIIIVNDRESVDLGEKTLQFIYFPWAHWPETMLTWLPGQGILFSCDLFGSHVASSDLFASDVAATLLAAKRYYAEIMMPFRPTIAKNIGKVTTLGAQIIAPSHGPVHKRPNLIVDAYRSWLGSQPKNMVLVPYISMHDSTRLMVERLVEACAAREVYAEQFNLAEMDNGKFAMSLVDAASIVFGTPTVHAGPHPQAAYAALLANALQPKAKYLSLIGSYGWGGKVAETMQALLSGLDAEFLPPVLARGLPRGADFAAIDALAEAIRERHMQPSLLRLPENNREKAFVCPVCHYVYDPVAGDPSSGIPPGTPFEDLPENWVCPVCRVHKSMLRVKKH